MASINKAILIGNVGRAVELRYTPLGVAVAQFSMATNRAWQKNGEWQNEPTWHNIIAWAQLAERIADSDQSGIGKGDQVYVEGRIQNRSWEGKDGTMRYRTEVVADRIYKLGRKEEGERRSFQDEAWGSLAEPDLPEHPGGSAMAAASSDGSSDDDDFDSLPF